jgi:alpha-tubulin suppressor-like RCC1 family protein
MSQSSGSTALHLQIACGLTHSVLCTDAGKVATFGGGSKGQLGQLEKLDNNGTPVFINSKQCLQDANSDRMVTSSSVAIIQVAAGGHHTAALRKDGCVYTWGSRANGRLGHGDQRDDNEMGRSFTAPMMVKSLQNMPIVQVSCGADFTLVVDNSGSVYSWGLGNYGNLGHGDTQDQFTPRCIQKLKSEVISMVAGGAKHSLAVSQSGDVWSFGHGDNGRLGNNSTRGSLVPERTQGKVNTENCIFVAAGESHSACVDDRGNVYTWGTGTYGRLGSGGENDQLVPMIVDTLAKIDSVMVSCGAFHTAVLTVTGDLWAFGGGLYGKLGFGNQENSMIPMKLPRPQNGIPYAQVACGSFHTLAVTENGIVYAWGFGGHGRLGLSKEEDMLTTPTALTSLDPATNKCSGSTVRRFRTLITKQDLIVHDGEQDDKDDDEPATRIIDVGAGAKHSMYCTSQGHVYTWGHNDCGQLGNQRNTVEPFTKPEQIKAHIGGLRIVSVACGANHSLCVTARGDVYTWGLGKSGQLGHGSTDNMTSPNCIQLLQGKTVIIVCGGEDNSGCVTDSGDLYTWGAGEMGKLGHGPATTSCLLPRLIRGDLHDKNVKQLSMGLSHTAVVVNQGTLYSWGAGWFGRLGHGDTQNVYEPKKIESLVFKRFKQISCGSYHSIAVTVDNECYTWGRGDERLGVNARTNQLLPMLVESLSSRHINIDYVVASEEHSMAVGIDGTVYAWGLGKYCKLGVSEPDAKNKEDDVAMPEKVLSLFQKGMDADILNLDVAPADFASTSTSGSVAKVDRRMIKSLSNHNIALDQNGTVWVWGCAGQGRLGVEHATRSIPLAVPRDIAFHEEMYGDVSAGQDVAQKRSGQGGGVDGSGALGFGESKEGALGAGQSDRGGRSGRTGRGGRGGRSGRTGRSGKGGSSSRVGAVGQSGTPGDIDDIVMRFRRDRTNPSANFVHRLLKVEPTANRGTSIALLQEQLAEDRRRLESYMFDVSESERQVKDLETETEILIKSTIGKKMPSGIEDTTNLVPDDIIAHHSTFAKIFEILLANPSYFKEMHKFFTGRDRDVLQLWDKEAYQLGGTFKRRFAHLALSVYGHLDRDRNQHLFLVFAKNVLLEEMVQKAGSFDIAKNISDFNGSGSVFGEIVRSYFSLDRCVDNVSERYKEVFTELVAKTDSNEYNFEYDPIQIYLEQNVAGEGAVRGAVGKDQKFDDAYREDLYQSLGSVKNKVNARISKMSEIAGKWIAQTTSNVSTIPDGVRWICRQLLDEMKKTYGNAGSNVEHAVAHFLFDMYFRPGIINPGAYNMIDSRDKLDRRVVKNLNEIANLVKRSLTQTKFHSDRARWMSEANGVIDGQKKTALLWVQDVCKIEIALPEKLLNDVYSEHLGHGRVVHTIKLPDVQLCRWMLMKLERFSTSAVDPMKPYVTGEFGICPNGKCPSALDFQARPDSYAEIGIKFELNCRYFKVMKRDLVRLDHDEVPLPYYLAGSDCTKVADIAIDPNALDQKRTAFQQWLKEPKNADYSLPEDDDAQSINFVRNKIIQDKDDEIKKGKGQGQEVNYEKLAHLSLALELMEQLSTEKIPLSQVMGELLEQYAERRSVARRQKQQLIASQALFVKVNKYSDRLKNRIIALRAFLDQLTKDGKSNNYDQAHDAATKLGKRLANPNMVRDAHRSGRKNKLKQKLAKNKELHGSHGSFTYNELKKAGVIINFELRTGGMESKKDDTAKGSKDDEMSKKETKMTQKKLTYLVSVFCFSCLYSSHLCSAHQLTISFSLNLCCFVWFSFLCSFFSFSLFLQVSSVNPGVFHVVCVFDGDTVLDHFEIMLMDLLEQERSMKSEFRPGHSIKNIEEEEEQPATTTTTFGHVAKTTFHIKNLLEQLQSMSMNYKMLEVS